LATIGFTPKDAEKAAVLTVKNQLEITLVILIEAEGSANAAIIAKGYLKKTTLSNGKTICKRN
jgi:hypothetical protein